MKKKYTFIPLLVLGFVLLTIAIYQNQKTGDVSSVLITIGVFCCAGSDIIRKRMKKSRTKKQH